MSLESAILQQDPFIYGLYNEDCTFDVGLLIASSPFENHQQEESKQSLPPIIINGNTTTTTTKPTAIMSRRKRRRSKNLKNKEEMENQRMTHIAVERNRRRQMNHYLALLRTLMPPSYAQRGDQASIVGGAITYVKELEQLVHYLEAHQKNPTPTINHNNNNLFGSFFNLPQYSTDNINGTIDNTVSSEIADIEVTMVERHANIKISSKRRQPKQLLKMVAGFQSISFTILHLSITTVDQTVLYSFSVKVEEECQLTTVNEIATAVHNMLVMIQEQMMST